MGNKIIIKATRPDGIFMFYGYCGWTSHASDAKDWRTHEAAAQAAAWDRELRNMTRYGFTVDILEKPA